MGANRGNERAILALAINPKGFAEKIRAEPAVLKRLYTIEEAAIYLGRSPAAVRRLISLGYLPSVRIGPKRIALDKVDMDRIIEQGKVWHLDR